MGIFDKKNEISRRDLRDILRKTSPYVPGGGYIPLEKRVEIEKKVFSKNLGPLISKRDFQFALRELEKHKYYAKSSAEKIEIDREIRLLKKLAEPSPTPPEPKQKETSSAQKNPSQRKSSFWG